MYHRIGHIHQCQIGPGVFRFLWSFDRCLDRLWYTLYYGIEDELLEHGGSFMCLCLSIQGALCYAELGCAYVSSGGDYTYLRVAFGNFIGFLRVWIEVALSRPMIVVLSVLTAANYLVYFIYPNCQAPETLLKCISSVLLLIVGFINLSSGLWTNRLHQVCNYFKIGRIEAFCFCHRQWLSV